MLSRRDLFQFAAPALAGSAAGFQGPSAKDRVVLVISVDGFPGWEWQNPRLPVPNLWKLAQSGVRAETVKITNPTVTWPTHTSMITGVRSARHGVLANGLVQRNSDSKPVTVKPWHDREDLVQATTIYDLAYDAGLTTAEVDWVAIYNAKRITWRFPEVPDPAGKIEREMIEAGLIFELDIKEFFKSSPVWRDQQWTQAGVHIITKHAPNLLLFHLLNTDAANHAYGPRTPASQTAYAFADECVAKLLNALKTANLWERATVFIVTDHGFKPITSAVKPNAILRQMGLVRGSGSAIECDAWVLPIAGIAGVYFVNPEKKAGLAARLPEVFAKAEGVLRVLAPDEFAAFDLPHPDRNSRAPDLVLVAKDGYTFNAAHEGDATGPAPYRGTHGYPASDPDMNGTFIASGYGIRKGARLDQMSHLDVGPTIGALLGIEMKNVEGRVLTEILDASALSRRM
ncbi:MAG TPA: ectonucleotide pyrophosphatase/phosphodiesterase [Bryobacteraceae bacterium]|nr:ectonucleotide pyrophosphatase/phosphodiesterase [Bryobacteraceae bacterium]